MFSVNSFIDDMELIRYQLEKQGLRIQECIGQGCYGRIYKLIDVKTGKVEKVLKVSLSYFGLTPNTPQGSEHKAYQVCHPHINTPEQFFYWSGHSLSSTPEKNSKLVAMVLPFINGKTLGASFDFLDSMTTEEVFSFYLKLAKALEVLKNAKLEHKDLHPSNIMVDNNQNPIIIDLDLIQTSEKNSDVIRVAACIQHMIDSNRSVKQKEFIYSCMSQLLSSKPTIQELITFIEQCLAHAKEISTPHPQIRSKL
jgi:serine/threonine protein kinase